MAHYLVQVAYTPEAWAALIKDPKDRITVLKPVLEKLGGRFETAYFSFGDYDIAGILEMPGNVDAAAFAIAAAGGGAIKSIKTTPLMTMAEGIDAMKKAAQSGYVAPQTAAAGV
jgi:uncharacterized protein with GYD domain